MEFSRNQAGDELGNRRSGERLSRRALLGATGAGGLAAMLATRGVGASRLRRIVIASANQATRAAETVIDLPAEPRSLDPALTYDIDGWSVVHSVYDSLVQYGPSGAIEPLLAESVRFLDPRTYEIKLRQGISFHNGEALDATAVTFSVAHILDKNTSSQIKDNFAVISEVREIDPLTVHLVLSRPAPWLPAQIAPWLALLPPRYAAANDFGQKPVGTGPYRFVEWKSGEHLSLEVNPDYFAGSPKGQPIARKVTYRFVPDASTRVSDLRSGTATLIRGVPIDQTTKVQGDGAQVVVTPVSGSSWIRIPTDVAPFSDVRVRQALNYAVDVDTIVTALLGGNGKRLPNFFVEGGLGYDPTLAPYSYDPDKAKALLKDAGFEKGFDTALDYTTGERADLVTAVVGLLGDVGVRVKAQVREIAAFNQTWKDTNAAPLRFVTWRPMFDPFTVLNLLISNKGFLSRHDNPDAQSLIDAGAAEIDAAKRADVYRQLGKVLRDAPAAIYLFSLTARYGVAKDVPSWSPRADDYIIATKRSS